MAYGNYAPFYRAGYFNPMQAPTMPTMADGQNQYGQPYQAGQAQTMQNPVATPTQSSNDIIWVQGEAGAKAYLIAPNNTVTLWDSESPTIYVKSADMNGVPSMRILDFTERTVNAPKTVTEHICKCGEKYVTKEQFEGIQAKISEIEGIVDDLKTKTSVKATKTTKKSEE